MTKNTPLTSSMVQVYRFVG